MAIPTVVTDADSNIYGTPGHNGHVSNTGGATVTTRGFNYETNEHTTSGAVVGTGNDSGNVGGSNAAFSFTNNAQTAPVQGVGGTLEENGWSGHRAYAKNSSGTGVGGTVAWLIFQGPGVPVGTTDTYANSCTQITVYFTPTARHDFINGWAAIGVVWSTTNSAPTQGGAGVTTAVYQNPFVGTNGVQVNLTITVGTPGTTTYVRGFFNNGGGSHGYGSTITSSTLANTTPSCTTTALSSFAFDRVNLQGSVDNDGCQTVTERGWVWSQTNATPTTSDNKVIEGGTGTGTMTLSTLTGLSQGQPIYVRAYGTNSNGTAYGAVQSITNIPTHPPKPFTMPFGNVRASRW